MAYAPDPRRRSLFAGTPPLPAPFLTPRPERRRVDARWVEGGSFQTSHDREVNVQVIVRCRPLTDEEQRLNVANVISCNDYKKEVIISQSAAYKQVDKIFTFDKVFGPEVQQKSIYDQAISPIVNDVLEGFNCTIFAYGQTGTGKTYTMEGGMKNKGGELPVDAGVIPRAVRQLFDTLEGQKADYDMKVTFLEIYNEEITDLLAPEDYSRYLDDRQKKLISLMEDGRGGVIVRGLEEVVVHSANEIYSILERVSLKRRTSETLLNKHSSRSHSIFSITINVKESTTVNEEVIKSGKLNLVDLAGSENISTTGAREGRAREAGEINKSLLTLGRVINALVEYSSHTPYRDSKLTRLLRDSLGGKTKTCIIATVSPAAYCLEETLSTLDLAYRAKTIKNKPEVNQKLSKSILLKDLHLEIEKLKQDVRAAREKNGVYMPYERFVQNEAEKKATAEKIEQLECHLDHREKDIKRMHEIHVEEKKRNLDLENQVNELKFELENTNRALQDLHENYHRATLELQEKDSIITNLQLSENLIIERAKDLRGGLQAATDDMSLLFTKLDCKNRIEAGNHEILLSFRCQLDESLTSLQKAVEESVSNQHQQLRRMQENLGSFIARKFEANKNLESRIDNMRKIYDSGVMAIKGLACALQKKASSDLENTKLTMSAQKINIENFLVTAVSEAEHVLEDIQSSLSEQKHLMSICARQQQEGLHKNLMTTQVISRYIVDFFHDLNSLSNKVIATTEEKHKDMTQQFEAFEKTFQEESIKEEKVALENFAKILAIMQTEKTNMISEALKNMKNKSIDENNLVHEEMLKVQHISTKAEACWSSYIEKVEYQFQEDTSLTADTSAVMAKNLDKCTNKVNQSKRQWESAQVFVNHHNKSFTTEIESAAEKQFHENKTLLEDFTVSSSATEADFDVGILGLLTATEDSITLDHKYKEDTEKISSVCFDLMKVLQNNHSERVEEMRNRAENCLAKEYLLDEPTSAVPERRAITVPRLASIERLRKTSDLNLSLSNKTSEGHAEAKQSSTLSEVARSPLAPLN